MSRDAPQSILAIGEGGTNKFALSTSNRRVSYFYDPDVGGYYYGAGHPMKPQRMRMTHSLVMCYGLYDKLDVYRPHSALESELGAFHDDTYVHFLAEIGGQNWRDFSTQAKRFNVGEGTDCPLFDGLFPFQRSCAGASIDAAMKLNHFETDIAINWSGGLHHAKRAEASGFCYINDIVLGVLELLKYHPRVMYIDIDIHHGDGVEEAFFVTHRVMTVSFHKFGDYFPGTGDLSDVGAAAGKHYSVNVPLDDGVDDASFLDLFKAVVGRCIDVYRPGAIVVQCGADSVAGDRLGKFNLSIAGHASCVEYVKSYNIPLMVLGGGGYTIRNVARTWLYETAVCLGEEKNITDEIPDNDYSAYYGPSNKLHLPLSDIANKNHKKTLDAMKEQIFENLRQIEHAPSVDFSYVPPDFFSKNIIDNDEVRAYELEEGVGRAVGDTERMDSVSHLVGNRESSRGEGPKGRSKRNEDNENGRRSKRTRYANALLEDD
eukprot:GHVH01004600.1.p1 GENE.GHVH01004600.1~~GHVH01004600.1.p1  ORF type:complete len:488 (+),score=71.74 GHVH01004600.1:65-1528(+)